MDRVIAIYGMNSRQEDGDVYRLHADTRLAEQLLGYTAGIDFETGMNRYLAWFAQTYPDPSILLEDDPVNWQMPDAG